MTGQIVIPKLPPDPSKPDGISVLDCAVEAEFMAQWLFLEWGDYDPNETLDTCRADLLDGLNADVEIPKTFVYRKDGQIAGWAGVIQVDLTSRPRMGPWFANLVVLPDFRNQGIAHALIQHVMDYARTVTDVLYLYTDNLQSTYALLGWTAIEEVTLPTGKTVTIMRWDPAL